MLLWLKGQILIAMLQNLVENLDTEQINQQGYKGVMVQCPQMFGHILTLNY